LEKTGSEKGFIVLKFGKIEKFKTLAMRSPQLFLFFLALMPVFSNAQTPPTACTSVYSHEFIFGNNVRADISNSGQLFFDGGDGQFLLPFIYQDTLISTIFSNGLWIGGLDNENKLKIAAAVYGLGSNNNDFWPGPLDETEGTTEQTNCHAWNRIWSVRKFEIEQHLADFLDNGQINNPLPSLLAWPGRGNPHFENIFGFALPDTPAGLAPFFDQNNDEIYNPLNGDYPLPEGLKRIPEQVVWCIYNDEGGGAIHQETHGIAIKAEIQLTVWAFSCEDDNAINNTVFTSHKIVNRSASVLDSFHVSIFNDGDIGCYRDDYAGCNPALNTQFFYNADADDGPGCPASFMENPPVQTVTMLNHDMDYFRVFTLDCPFFPTVGFEFFAVMTGRGLTDGGTSCNPNAAPTNFAFPGDPNDPSAWSMLSENFLQNDVRTLATVNFGTLEPGAYVKLDVAYSQHRGEGLNNLENVTLALEEVAHIKSLYDNQFDDNCIQPSCTDDCVWAGDANHDGIANYLDLQSIALALGKEGPQRASPYIWSAKNGETWNEDLPNTSTDLKHSDCDGNGTVKPGDFILTTLHYNFTNPDYEEPPDVYPPGPELFLTAAGNHNFNELMPGQSFFARLNLVEVPDLFALSFQIEFDSRYFEEFDPFANGFGQYDPLRFGSDLRSENHLVEADFSTARQHLDSLLHPGVLFALRVKVRNTFDPDLPSEKTLVKIKNIMAIRKDGTSIKMGATTLEATVMGLKIANSIEDRQAVDFYVFPNPSDGRMNIKSQAAVQDLRVFSPMGQLIYSDENAAPFFEKTIELNEVAQGLYLVKCRIEGKVLVEKLFIIN
jgi:hypothetical protein